MSAAPLAVAVSGRGLVDPELPTVRVDDEAVSRGRAAFETLRVYDGKPFRLAQHVERMCRSSATLGLPPPDPRAVEELAQLALGAAGAEGPDLVLRLYWTPGPPGGDANAIAVVTPVPSWIEEVRPRGQRLAALPFPRRSLAWLLPGTKSTSYATHLAAEAEARRRGADDAILIDLDGTVLEGTVTNVWWREGGALFTPSLELGILAGETRAALCEVAPESGYSVEEGLYPLARLLAAEEVFTSSSVREVMPACVVDETAFAPGPAAARLQAALRALAR
jgi:branched-chain amino acid aminotransferase